jgi:hypothetical protein
MAVVQVAVCGGCSAVMRGLCCLLIGAAFIPNAFGLARGFAGGSLTCGNGNLVSDIVGDNHCRFVPED